MQSVSQLISPLIINSDLCTTSATLLHDLDLHAYIKLVISSKAEKGLNKVEQKLINDADIYL